MHKQRLPVAVHVGLYKPGNGYEHTPVVVRWNTHAEAWFPPSAVNPRDVAHEGLHLAEWAQKRLGTSPEVMGEVVPWYCPSWNVSTTAVKEEMRARLLDGFVFQFFNEAQERGVVSITSLFVDERLAARVPDEESES